MNFIKMDLVGVFNLHLISLLVPSFGILELKTLICNSLVEFRSAWEKIREKRDLQSGDWRWEERRKRDCVW